MTAFLSIGLSSVAAIAASWTAYERKRARRLRKHQMLIKGIKRAVHDPWAAHRRAQASSAAHEMEARLSEIRLAADAVVCALSVEEAAKRISVEAAVMKANRETSEQAQSEYYESVERYREFVLSLAPPLRAQAAERGRDVMILGCA